jgi:bifunctional pyridoxal-dependent enzyme with beta-cystathionase and maltose regulon repressor activities
MTYALLNQNQTSLSDFDTIPQIISHIKSLNLPSSTLHMIFPPHNPTTSVFFLLTLKQLIKTFKNSPNELN